MTEILFYHLERARLEGVLPGLLEKTLERGLRAVVKTSDRSRAEAIDQLLWTYRDESFLPHACDGDAARQPVWITAEDERPNDPQILFLVDGAGAAADSLHCLERCVMIFDGGDDKAVADARGFWKAAAASGHDATYWRQNEQGGWKKQA